MVSGQDVSIGRLWYKFPPLWSVGTEVSCRGQFRIAAMSVTAVLEGRVLNSRPVTLLYTYLPCPSLPPASRHLLALSPLSLALFHYHSPSVFPSRCTLHRSPDLASFQLSQFHGPASVPLQREGGTRPGIGSANGHARPIGNNKANQPRACSTLYRDD